MSQELIKEIIKSYVYGMTFAEMSSAYGMSEAKIASLLDSNKEEVAKEYEYRIMMEGGGEE